MLPQPKMLETGRGYPATDFLPTTNATEKKTGLIYCERNNFHYAKNWKQSDTKEQQNQAYANASFLSPLELLLIGINIFNYRKRQHDNTKLPLTDINNCELMQCLQIAADKFPIAHYFMVQVLQHFVGDNASKQIAEHLQKAVNGETKNDDIKALDMYLPNLQYPGPTPKTFAELLSKAEQEYLQCEEPKKCSIYLLKYSKGYEEKTNFNEAIKFHILAASYAPADALPAISKNLAQQFPDLDQTHLINALKEIDSFQDRKNVVTCYLAIYNIYKCLLDNKDSTSLIGNAEEERQKRQQLCFIADLNNFHKVSTCELLKKYVETTGTQQGLTAETQFVFFKGTQEFQDLRLELVNCAQSCSMDNLKIAVNIFSESLKNQKKASTFAAKLLNQTPAKNVNNKRNDDGNDKAIELNTVVGTTLGQTKY